MFDVTLSANKVATLRDVLADLGNSISLSEIPGASNGEVHIAVHIHTVQEKKVIRFAERLGTLANLRTTHLYG